MGSMGFISPRPRSAAQQAECAVCGDAVEVPSADVVSVPDSKINEEEVVKAEDHSTERLAMRLQSNSTRNVCAFKQLTALEATGD